MAVLGVNVDHVATLRQARLVDYPDPYMAAKIALDEGVAGITVHLREDRRHIQDDDVRRIRSIPGCKLNLEMAAWDGIIDFAMDVRPDQVTLVPERREELTTEGGLDIASRIDFFADLTKRFHDKGITVSFFIDPLPAQVEAAAASPVDAVEINTGAYADAVSEKNVVRALRHIADSVKMAKGLGLAVHAGHGLNYRNVIPIAEMRELEELNIGHSIVSQAVYSGFARAVSMMKDLIEQAERRSRKAG